MPGRMRVGRTFRVLIERLANREAKPPERDVIGNVRSADRAEIDRIKRAKLIAPSAGIITPCFR